MSSIQPDINLNLHCQINEKAFSRALFMCRLLTGGVLVYLSAGSLLYWREFMVNTVSFGVPHAAALAMGLAAAQLFVGLFLILGWYTRFWAILGGILSLICMVVFFAGNFNAVFVAMCLLLCAPLSVLIWLGAGAISLDYKRSQRKLLEFFRG